MVTVTIKVTVYVAVWVAVTVTTNRRSATVHRRSGCDMLDSPPQDGRRVCKDRLVVTYS